MQQSEKTIQDLLALSRKRKTNRNFTLIELLIVVAIIAILAGMLLPALNKARESARQISCQSNLKSYMTALFNYQGDFGEFVPNGTGFGHAAYGGITNYANDGTNYNAWKLLLAPYLGINGIRSYDPTNSTQCSNSTYDIYVKHLKKFLCNSIDLQKTAQQRLRDSYDIGWNYLASSWYRRYRMRDIKKPISEVVVYGDTAFKADVAGFYWASSTIFTRHKGGHNTSWADGHVSFMNNQNLHADKYGLNGRYWFMLYYPE